MKTKIKCPKCNHEWVTKSDYLYITCPNCQRKFERKPKDVDFLIKRLYNQCLPFLKGKEKNFEYFKNNLNKILEVIYKMEVKEKTK